MEIEELKRQRDLAQTQVDELRKKLQEDQQVSLSLSPPSHTAETIHYKFQLTLRSFITSGLNAT